MFWLGNKKILILSIGLQYIKSAFIHSSVWFESTAMVMSRWSVPITTFFSWASLTKQLTSMEPIRDQPFRGRSRIFEKVVQMYKGGFDLLILPVFFKIPMKINNLASKGGGGGGGPSLTLNQGHGVEPIMTDQPHPNLTQEALGKRPCLKFRPN